MEAVKTADLCQKVQTTLELWSFVQKSIVSSVRLSIIMREERREREKEKCFIKEENSQCNKNIVRLIN